MACGFIYSIYMFSILKPLLCKRLRVYTLHNSKKAVTAD